MATKLKRRKVHGGEYEIVDAAIPSRVVGEVYEAGKSGYRWRCQPNPRVFPNERGWDTQSISSAISDLERMLNR
jgi:hypothetical protein